MNKIRSWLHSLKHDGTYDNAEVFGFTIASPESYTHCNLTSTAKP